MYFNVAVYSNLEIAIMKYIYLYPTKHYNYDL